MSADNSFTVTSLKQEITNLQSKLLAGIKVGITETNICFGNDVLDLLYTYTSTAEGTIAN